MKNVINILSFFAIIFLPVTSTYGQAQNENFVDKIIFEEIFVEKSHFSDLNSEIPVKNFIIGDDNVIDVSLINNKKINVFAKNFGTSNLRAYDEKNNLIISKVIIVRRPTLIIQKYLDKIFGHNKIEVASVGANIILSGALESVELHNRALSLVRQFVDKDEDILDMININVNQQVLLKVRIAEMERAVLKTIGGSAVKNGTQTSFNIAPTLGASLGVASEAFATINLLDNVGFIDDLTFSALEREGLVKTLAEPSLTAISGETANFLAGGEIPVPSGRDQSGNVSIEFKSFGVALSFTPIVLSKSDINLRIKTEVSRIADNLSLTIQGTNIQGLTVRRAETTVNLSSGGQIMIAGLFNNNNASQIEGLPLLKDIPILGALFRSKSFKDNTSELIVMVQPFIASEITSNLQIPMPVQRNKNESDLDFYFGLNGR
jgi:pilus assembly protein CpaC